MLKPITFSDRAPFPNNLVNGSVRGVCDDGEYLYLSGDFNRCAFNNVPYFCKIDTINGKLKPLSKIKEGFNGPVYDICIVGDYAYVGGSFTTYNNTSANHIAKIKISDGTLDTSFIGSPDSDVRTIIKDPRTNHLYIGGYFYSWMGYNCPYLVKVNASTGIIDSRFDTDSGSANGAIYKIIYDNESLYLCGEFTTYKGVERGRVVKIDAHDAGIDGNFRPIPGFDSYVLDMALDPVSRCLYCGGYFNSYNSTYQTYLAKINSDDGSLISFPYVNGYVYSIEIDLDFNNIYVAGNQTGGYLQKINATDGSVLWANYPTWTPSKVIQDPTSRDLFVSGNFIDYAGTACSKIARIYSIDGNIISSFTNSNGLNGRNAYSGNAMTLAYNSSTDEILVGTDSVMSYGGIQRIGLVKVRKSDWTVDPTFNPGSSFGEGSGFAQTIIKDPNSNYLYLAGPFWAYQGYGRSSLLKINSLTATIDMAFDPTTGFTGANAAVYSMIQIGNFLYCGGSFTKYKGASKLYIVKISCINAIADGTFNTSTGANNAVWSILYDPNDSGNIIIGGAFTSFKGTSRARIAKISNSNAIVDTNFISNTGANAAILCLYQQPGSSSVFAGGDFTTYKSISRVRIVKLNAYSSAIDTTFVGTASPNGVNGSVYQMGQDTSGNIIAVGNFFTYGSAGGNYTTKLNSSTGARITSFLNIQYYPSMFVERFIVNNNNLYLLGQFNYLIRYTYNTYTIYSGCILIDTTTALPKTK